MYKEPSLEVIMNWHELYDFAHNNWNLEHYSDSNGNRVNSVKDIPQKNLDYLNSKNSFPYYKNN